MHRKYLVRSLGAVAGLLLLSSSSPAVAAEPEEGGQILFNSEFMIMDSFGTDLNVFDTKLEDDDGDARTTGTDLGHDEDFGWRGDLQYKDGAWGFGISGFHFDTDGSEDTRLNQNDALEELSLRTANAGCDTDDNSGQDCFANVDSDLEMWMVDLYGIRELVSTPDVTVDLQLGLRLAHYDWEADLLSGAFEEGTDLIADDEDPVGASATSEPDDDALAGPFMALFSSGRYGRFRAEAQLTQAVVFGELEQDIRVTQYFDGDEGSTTGNLLPEEFNTKTQSQDAVIPITDIRLKLGYDIMDNLTLGFGAYATTWFNVPEVPNMESSDFASVENNRISTDEENITLLGASFSLEYRFNGGPDLGSWLP